MRISHLLRLKSSPRRTFFVGGDSRARAGESQAGSYGYMRELLNRQLKNSQKKIVGSSTISGDVVSDAEPLAPRHYRVSRTEGC